MRGCGVKREKRRREDLFMCCVGVGGGKGLEMKKEKKRNEKKDVEARASRALLALKKWSWARHLDPVVYRSLLDGKTPKYH